MAGANVYGVSLLWDGEPRYVETGAVGLVPLLGMALLDGYDLNVQVKSGGQVAIQPIE